MYYKKKKWYITYDLWLNSFSSPVDTAVDEMKCRSINYGNVLIEVEETNH